MNETFKKRLKSFLWRSGAIFVVALIAFLTTPETVGQLGVPQLVVLILGLVAAEFTKYLNRGDY